jgi:hypothetical protein
MRGILAVVVSTNQKNMKKRLILILTALLSKSALSQNCSCADNFSWLKETFEKNDAGFQYVIDKKGEADYKKHSDLYAEKVKSITDKEVCTKALLEWLRYFRRGHLWLQSLSKKEAPEKADEDKIRKQFKDWEKYSYNEKEFNSYISQLKAPTLEGVWSSPPYKIGIRKVNNEYLGFILESDGVYWTKGQVKFRVKENNGKLSGTYYMRDHSSSEIKSAKLLGSNYVSLGASLLKRISPVFPADKSLDMAFKFQSTEVPLFEKISDKTVILRIPSFDGSAKKQIDSLITSNMPLISKTENLIIDLQNNGGGSDGSFSKIIPLIYTDPIKIIGLEYLSTPLNNQRMSDMAKESDMSAEDKKWVSDALEKLNRNLGKFVNLDSTIVFTETLDSIYAYPKRVGIIINGGCGSTTEQFLLAAKQSKKVKLFGTTTFGSLDISNMYSVKSPCNDLELGYCLSKSFRIPDFAIDGIGLQPDYYIDKTIPRYEWISFVNEILSKP